MNEAEAKTIELIFGRWRSQILYTGVTLAVVDALAAGPTTTANAAGELNVDAAALYRLMRALCAVGILNEDDNQTFALTAMGETLRRDHPRTLRPITLLEEGPEHYAAWKHLPALIREGTQDGFAREFGQAGFEYARTNPSYGAVFNDAMSSFSAVDNALVLEALQPYDFAGIAHLCDVGGGHGYALCNLLTRHPRLKGTVLELPDVLANKELLWADKLRVADRCAYVAGDMFVAVPVADAYFVKRVLHDWSDADCEQILSTMHRAAPRDARLLIVEQVVPGPECPHFSKLFDVHMMVWGNGRERTAEEYADLLKEAGWRYRKTWYPSSKMIGIVEAVKA
ncbi:MAG TPA: methyltransferase [Casimicrobiaceae bacterium]